jgi:hypothetical protein
MQRVNNQCTEYSYGFFYYYYSMMLVLVNLCCLRRDGGVCSMGRITGRHAFSELTGVWLGNITSQSTKPLLARQYFPSDMETSTRLAASVGEMHRTNRRNSVLSPWTSVQCTSTTPGQPCSCTAYEFLPTPL